MKFMPLSLAVAVLFPALALAQQDQAPPLYPAPGNPAEQQSQQNLANQQNSQTPVFRVNVYARTARAVNYRNRGGSTSVDFKGTELMPSITGHAKIDGKAGRLAIDADLDHVGPTSAIGPQYLTYVL